MPALGGLRGAGPGAGSVPTFYEDARPASASGSVDIPGIQKNGIRSKERIPIWLRELRGGGSDTLAT